MSDQSPRLGLNRYAQGDTGWDHTDLVNYVDEHSIERDVKSNRPNTGDYDDQLFYATDEEVLYRWIDASGSWVAVLGAANASIDDSDSPYQTSGESIIYTDTSNGPVEIELATADTVAGKSIKIIDSGQNAGTNTITITTEGSQNINPGTNSQITISVDGATAELESDGSNWFSDRVEEKDSISTDKANTVEWPAPSDDIQAILDKYDRRSAELRFDYGEAYVFNTPLNTGELTTYKGAVGSKQSYAGQSFGPTTLDFSSTAQNGIQVDPNSGYRPQRNLVEDLAIIGSGSANGKSGISLQANSNSDPVDLWDVENVWIEDFNYGVYGNRSDSCNFYRMEIHNCSKAFAAMGSETKIEDCILWDLTGGPMVEFTQGGGSHIKGSEIQPNTFNTVITIENNDCKVLGNTFQGSSPYGTAVRIYGGAGAVVSNNTFRNEGKQALWIRGASDPDGSNVFANNTATCPFQAQPLDVDTNSNVIANNDFAEANLSTHSVPRWLDIDGSYNVIWGNILPGDASSESVRVNSGTENILMGHFPNGVTDNGTRTIINGRSYQSAAPGSGNTGDEWGGSEAKASQLDVTVVDTSSTSPRAMYKADGDGSWAQIA
jgi:hypothetical protein